MADPLSASGITRPFDYPASNIEVMNALAERAARIRQAQMADKLARDQMAAENERARLVDERERWRYELADKQAAAAAKAKAAEDEAKRNEKRLGAARTAAKPVREALNDRDLAAARAASAGVFDIGTVGGVNDETSYMGEDGQERLIPGGMFEEPAKKFSVSLVGNVPGMDPFEVDPEANRRARMQRAGVETDTFVGSITPSTDLEKRALEYTGQVGRSGQAARPLPEVYSERRKELETQAGLDRRAAMAGTRPRQATPFQGDNFDLRVSSEARQLLKDVQSSTGYGEQLRLYRSSESILSDLTSGNAASQRAALGAWAKDKSGPGAVQQTERNEFVNYVGGRGEAIKKAALEWIGSGKLPETQLPIFIEAVRDFEMKRQRRRLSGIKNSVKKAYMSHPNKNLRQYADWAADQIEIGQGAPDEPDATPQELDELDEMEAGMK